MSTILSFLGSLKLTLEQWMLLLAFGALGVLVVLFKLQGSKLHAAQVQLADLQFSKTMQSQNQAVNAATARYNSAKKAYEAAK